MNELSASIIEQYGFKKQFIGIHFNDASIASYVYKSIAIIHDDNNKINGSNIFDLVGNSHEAMTKAMQNSISIFSECYLNDIIEFADKGITISELKKNMLH